MDKAEITRLIEQAVKEREHMPTYVYARMANAEIAKAGKSHKVTTTEARRVLRKLEKEGVVALSKRDPYYKQLSWMMAGTNPFREAR